MRWRRLAAATLAAALPLFLAGCLFAPRDPDGAPDQDETQWETPISTTIVLQNIKAALEGENSSNHRDSFTEDYRFHVDPQDSLDAAPEGEQRYANWGRDDEEHAVIGMFNDASSIVVTFTNVTVPNEGDEETSREEDYELVVSWSSGAHVNEEVTYKGRANLHMRRDDTGRWAIFRWVDRRIADPEVYQTWGVLRGEYRH